MSAPCRIGWRVASDDRETMHRATEKPKRGSFIIFLAGMLSLFAGTSHATEIKVVCDSPVEPALSKVADLYHQETNNRVILACNAGPVVKKKIEDGEAADVVVIEPDFAEELTHSGKLREGYRPMIGHVGIGLGNRTD